MFETATARAAAALRKLCDARAQGRDLACQQARYAFDVRAPYRHGGPRGERFNLDAAAAHLAHAIGAPAQEQHVARRKSDNEAFLEFTDRAPAAGDDRDL